VKNRKAEWFDVIETMTPSGVEQTIWVTTPGRIIGGDRDGSRPRARTGGMTPSVGAVKCRIACTWPLTPPGDVQ